MPILPHPKTIDPLQELRNQIDAQSYNWLNSNYPDILTAVEQAVANGQTPDGIKSFVSRETYGLRVELALRCYQAARHIKRQAEQ
jgi:alpha-mannosidase